MSTQTLEPPYTVQSLSLPCTAATTRTHAHIDGSSYCKIVRGPQSHSALYISTAHHALSQKTFRRSRSPIILAPARKKRTAGKLGNDIGILTTQLVWIAHATRSRLAHSPYTMYMYTLENTHCAGQKILHRFLLAHIKNRPQTLCCYLATKNVFEAR